MKVTIIGTGFVGVTSSVVYASFGNQVVGLDIDVNKVMALNGGEVPFYEPKLAEMLQAGLESGDLHFTTSYEEAVKDAEVVIFAVGTPSRDDGSIDLAYLHDSLKQAAPYLADEVVVAIKSTVLPGTIGQAKEIVESITKVKVHYASLPEFLKEGTAVDDTLYPDRIVIGVEDDFAYEKLKTLHAPLKAPMLRVRPESAQLAKYASNDYLALRIVYANILADICAHSGADIDEVLRIMGREQRIGAHYWYPGLGYGGSCFPKDVKALAHYLDGVVPPEDNLFAFMNRLNVQRPEQMVEKLKQAMGGFKNKKIAVLGLAFKPNTDDQREAPALAIIPQLLTAGAKVVSFDPMVKKINNKVIAEDDNYWQETEVEDAITDADGVIALIEWPQIIGFDFTSVSVKPKTVFFDVRNQFDQVKIKHAGYIYLGNGRQDL